MLIIKSSLLKSKKNNYISTGDVNWFVVKEIASDKAYQALSTLVSSCEQLIYVRLSQPSFPVVNE